MPVTHTFASAIADDAAAAAAGEVLPSHWNDSHAIDSIEITGGTVTASTPLIDATQTWNNGAVTFTGWKLNVTNTASASGSLLADWQVGGVSKASIRKDGLLVITSINGSASGFGYLGNCGIGYQMPGEFVATGNGAYSFGNAAAGLNSPDVYLRRDAAATLAQRNGTNAQTSRVYGTYTDSSNYVRASLASSSTAVTLAAETAGTGADNVPVNITPAGTEGVVIGNFAQLTEMTAPAAGAANTARLFCEDNGGGKTRLMVQFASGAAQQIAIEP